MPLDVTLRPATAEEEPLLREIYASARRGALDMAGRHPQSAEAIIASEHERREAAYLVDFPGLARLVIECAGQPIGRTYMHWTAERLFVIDLIVQPAWRSRGIGTNILGLALVEARMEDCPVQLHVEKDNARARRLYERLGFKVMQDVRTHWLMEAR